MPLPATITDLTFKHAAQPDDLRTSLGSASAVKAALDSQSEELKTLANGIINALKSTTAGDGGSHNIGSASIAGVSGTTTYAQMVSLKTAIDAVATGEIPDSSLAETKLTVAYRSKQKLAKIYGMVM